MSASMIVVPLTTAITIHWMPSSPSEEALLEPVNQCVSNASDRALTAGGDEDDKGSDPLVALHSFAVVSIPWQSTVD